MQWCSDKTSGDEGVLNFLATVDTANQPTSMLRLLYKAYGCVIDKQLTVSSVGVSSMY